MSKTKKVWLGIGISLLVLFVAAYIVLSILFPEQTTYYTEIVSDYIFNKPLPVIGVSAAVLGFFVYKVVKVFVSNKGKNYKELLNLIGNLKSELAQSKEDAEKFKQQLEEERQKWKDNLKEITDAIPNKKVNELGEKIYGEETKEETNNETETEGL